jgi:hypothetical protein
MDLKGRWLETWPADAILNVDKERDGKKVGKIIWQYDILQYTEPAHTFKSQDQMTGF